MFQSLIGILVNCNSFVLQDYKHLWLFQSLIGILVNCNRIAGYCHCFSTVSIPNRDFGELQFVN